MKARTRRIALLALVWGLGVSLRAAETPGRGAVVQLRFLSFPSNSLYTAVQTDLEPGRRGRWRTQRVQLETLGGDSCKSLLSLFQDPPLEVMVRDGYISPELKAQLMRLLEQRFAPQQFVLMQVFSDYTWDQVLQRQREMGVSNDLRDSRIIERLPDGRLRVARGTLYAVKSYGLEVNARGELELASHRILPWELGAPLPTGLTRLWDAQKIPYRVEIGRAQIDPDLPRDTLRSAVQAMARYLANEADTLQIPQNQIVRTVNSKDPDHARLFTGAFPLRLLTDGTVTEMERDISRVEADYLGLPRPRGAEWRAWPDSVTFGFLNRIVPPLEDVSDFAAQLRAHLGWGLNGAQSRALLNGLAEASFRMLWVESENGRFRGNPILLRDLSSPFFLGRIRDTLSRVGISWGSAGAQSLEGFLSGYPGVMDQSALLASAGADGRMFLPVSAEEIFDSNGQIRKDANVGAPTVQWNDVEAMEPFVVLQNLDPRAAREQPIEYLAGVLRAVRYSEIRDWVSSSHEFRQGTLRTAEGHPRCGIPSGLQSVQWQDLAHIYPLAVYIPDEDIRSQLQALGGREFRGVSLNTEYLRTLQVRLQKSMEHFQVNTQRLQAIIDGHSHLPQAELQTRLNEEFSRQMREYLPFGVQLFDLLDLRADSVFLFTEPTLAEIERQFQIRGDPAPTFSIRGLREHQSLHRAGVF